MGVSRGDDRVDDADGDGDGVREGGPWPIGASDDGAAISIGIVVGGRCRNGAFVPSGDEPARDVRRPSSGASVEVDATGAALPPTVGPLAARGVLGSSSGGAGDVAAG